MTTQIKTNAVWITGKEKVTSYVTAETLQE
jgi:hypothetical protein